MNLNYAFFYFLKNFSNLQILKYEPNERMTIPEIKQHPFFKDVNWSNLVNAL